MERGKNKLVHPMADIIRHLVDKRICQDEGGYKEHVALTSEEKDALMWAACLLDDSNRDLTITKREEK